MKTRERILITTLALFNREGEVDQTAVDIAGELGISPGNLYYHFKGKDAIIHALYDRFEEEMEVILNGSRGQVTSVEDNWVYIYILLEEIYDFRFFYRDLGVLLDRYPDLAKRFRRLQKMIRKTVNQTLEDLAEAGRLSLDDRIRETVMNQMMMNLIFWLSKEQVDGDEHAGPELIHSTVFQIMSLIVPYMGEDGFRILNDMIAHRDEMMAG